MNTLFDDSPNLPVGSRILRLQRYGTMGFTKTVGEWGASTPEMTRSSIIDILKRFLLGGNIDFLGCTPADHEKTHNLASLSAEQLREFYENFLNHTVTDPNQPWDGLNSWCELVMIALMLVHYPDEPSFKLLNVRERSTSPTDKESWMKLSTAISSANPESFKTLDGVLMVAITPEDVLQSILKNSSFFTSFHEVRVVDVLNRFGYLKSPTSL